MDTDSNVIKNVLESLGISDTSDKFINIILHKAKELLRILLMKLPLGSLKQVESYRILIIVDLSCKLLNVPIERSKVLQLLTIGYKIYRKSLLTCKKVLNLNWVQKPAIEILLVKYGRELREEVQSYLNKYRKCYYDGLTLYQQKLIDLESPLYQCCAFAAMVLFIIVILNIIYFLKRLGKIN